MLDPRSVTPKLTRGGQEHDFYREGERVIKVTRNGVFGLSPGIEISRSGGLRSAEAHESATRRADAHFIGGPWATAIRRSPLLASASRRDPSQISETTVGKRSNTLEGLIVQPGDFIEETHAVGHSLRAVRTVTTHRMD